MGHHLLNRVKCVKEVRGLANALIISPSLFTDGGENDDGEVMTALTDVINYCRGA